MVCALFTVFSQHNHAGSSSQYYYSRIINYSQSAASILVVFLVANYSVSSVGPLIKRGKLNARVSQHLSAAVEP